MRRKIFSFYFILIMIGLSITGFSTFYLSQRFYKTEVEERMINSASLIRYQVLETVKRGNTADFNEISKTYSVILSSDDNSANLRDNKSKVRVTFINYEGNVLGESEKDYRNMENHLGRKEIQEAIQGKTGKDIRFSDTIETDFLYIALPIKEIKAIVRVSVPLVQIRKIYQLIWNYELSGMIIGIVLTLLLALKFSTSITQPISELIIKSREISFGNYSVRVKAESDDELGQLAGTFNDMASQLEKIVFELKDKNLKMDTILNSMTDGIIAVDKNFRIILINKVACKLFKIESTNGLIGSDFLEVIRNNNINKMLNETLGKRVVLSNEININYSEYKPGGKVGGKILSITTIPFQPLFLKSEDYNQTLTFNEGAVLSIQDITNIKKLEQMRSDFVSNVTHELKTPLTSIRGFVETLRNGAIHDDEVADKFLEIIDIEAERLYNLINDILQLGEIESAKNNTNNNANNYTNSNIGSQNIKKLIDESISLLKTQADKKGIIIHVDVQDNLLITANKDRIKQMLINLVDNGIKYNKSGGSVSVSSFKDEGNLVIKVADTGIGIPEEHLPRIFERFYRVDKGRSRSMGGTGLGLSIVKHIVNLYDGNIKVHSEPDHGTEFIIQLPLS
ncbi:MAG TPA: ATP-binding protein [Clostridiales bacterium]|nr:ATP-binding protein [Clostridiales bacterium]